MGADVLIYSLGAGGTLEENSRMSRSARADFLVLQLSPSDFDFLVLRIHHSTSDLLVKREKLLSDICLGASLLPRQDYPINQFYGTKDIIINSTMLVERWKKEPIDNGYTPFWTVVPNCSAP